MATASGVDFFRVARGTEVAVNRGMLTAPALSERYEPDPGGFRMSWRFVRRGRVLTCELTGSDRQSYDLWIVPLWDIQSSRVECFDNRADAIERHSEIVVQLQSAGWMRLSETGFSTLTAA